MAVILIVVLVVVIGGIVIAIFGWDRYRAAGKQPRDAAGSGAHPTTEVFLDPETGRRMRVWYDERTGQREYHPE